MVKKEGALAYIIKIFNSRAFQCRSIYNLEIFNFRGRKILEQNLSKRLDGKISGRDIALQGKAIIPL